MTNTGMQSKIRVHIIGAGAVGVSCAVSILHSRLVSHLSLYDVLADKAQGEALDLAHGAPLLGGVKVDGGGLDQLEAADLCIVAAGAKQRPGEDRLSLLARNQKSLDEIAQLLERRGLPRVMVLVTNPVDLMTEAMRRRLEPKGVAVFGSGTLLDTLRFRNELSQILDVSAESIHASVVGEHGDSSVCLFDSGRCGGLPLAEAFQARGLEFTEERRHTLATNVRGAAYQIISRKGATSHAIGIAVARIIRAVVSDERVVLPVSAPVESAMCAGVPCILGAHGASPLPLTALSPRERGEVDASFDILRRRCAELG
jgi:L-lactate dehydrogenase